MAALAAPDRDNVDRSLLSKSGLHQALPAHAEEMFIRRLQNFVALSAEEQAQLREVSSERVRTIKPRVDLVHEGEPPPALHLMLSGWACRYKTLEDGRRQIIAFLLPGDLCDLNSYVLRKMDDSIAAVTELVFTVIPHDRLASIGEAHPRIAQALWWHLLATLSVQREWTLNIGQRNAFERIGHLFCELFLRLRAVGLTRGASCHLPITQTELAEATGITPVHVNRTLQEMRSTRLIVLKDRVLTIPDFPALQRSVFFSPAYLHLGMEGAHLAAGAAASQA